MESVTKKKEAQGWKRVILFVYILMGVFFLPVLFCTIFIGNHMNYNETFKQGTLLPNYILLMIALLGGAALFGLTWLFRKQELTKRINYVFDGILALLFILLYFVNVWVAKEIIFYLPWDIMVVRVTAEKMAYGNPIGYFYYLSMYPNNIPITCILGRLMRMAQELSEYPYFADFIWIQVNCALISAGGFFSCLTVKKATKKMLPVIAAFFMYLVLAGVTPWKIAPYTDTYGMIFPIMSIYFYFCYREANKVWQRYLLLSLSLLCGMTGGFIKPSVYIITIAVLCVEFIRLMTVRGKGWEYFAAGILLTVGLFFAGKVYMNRLIEELGLDYNPEINASWQTYFLMGLNEESTGAYSSDIGLIMGEFQTDKNARNAAAFSRALGRMKEKGVIGTVDFWLRKMVMVFNDASFGWHREAWQHSPYPMNMASDTAITQELRDLFWPNAPHTGRYHTLCQLVWIFCLVGFTGMIFIPRDKRERYFVFAVSFLGIFLYQLLFEARARYLFVFLPLLIAIFAAGMQQYMEWGMEKLQSRINRKEGVKEHDRENEDAVEAESPGIH